jgi:hypothetical protein
MTRDGKVLKELGSWEREELKKLRKLPIEKVGLTRADKEAKKARVWRDPEMRFITKASVPLSGWVVKVCDAKRKHLIGKSFRDRDYNNSVGALKAAKAYRDSMVKEYKL